MDADISGQRPEKHDTTPHHSGPETRPTAQCVVSTPEQAALLQDDIGEKAAKLFELKHAGLNVPDFFVVAGNRSADLVVDSALEAAFSRISKPVVARSAHVAEGHSHSFSGVFPSFHNVSDLVQDRPDFSALDEATQFDAEWEFFHSEPTGLTEAYRQICETAHGGGHVRKYLEGNHIDDFDPAAMNIIVMEQVEVKVFAMFVTADQHDPNLAHIHYSVPGEEAADVHLSRYLDPSRAGVVTYDKSKNQILDGEIPGDLRPVLAHFGSVAEQIESLFGVQQVELAFDGDDVRILQSRNITLGDPTDAPRLPFYESLPGKYSAFGYGYYSLPVIVIDDINNTPLAYQLSDPKYRELCEAARDKSDESPEVVAVRQFVENRMNALREQLVGMKERFGDYTLVIKNAESIRRQEDLFWRTDYDFINVLARDARVVIQGRNQNAIRHEDWTKVEMGGLRLIPDEDSNALGSFHALPPQNRDLRGYDEVHSGDILNVLSNVDGVFVWPARVNKSSS